MTDAVRIQSASGGYIVTLPDLDHRVLGVVWRLAAPGPNGTADDVEAICVGVIAEVFRRGGFKEGIVNRDDALGFLLGEAVIQHRKYDPSKRHGTGSFSGYLYDRLRFRLLDYCRKVLRDAEHVAGDSDHGVDDEAGDRQLGGDAGSHGAPGEVAGDRGDPGVDALRGLLEGGDRALLREVAALGLSAPPGARGRDPQARAALARLDRARRARVDEADRTRDRDATFAAA